MAAAPVIAGLAAAGIAFVMAFSLYSVPRDSRTPLNKNEHIVMEIGNLKDTYRVNEPISFSIYVKRCVCKPLQRSQGDCSDCQLEKSQAGLVYPLPPFKLQLAAAASKESTGNGALDMKARSFRTRAHWHI